MTDKTLARALGGCVALCVSGFAAPAFAQDDGWSAPRTEWGAPDLRGMWPLNMGQTPMQRPAELGDQAFYTEEEYAAARQEAQTVADNFQEEDQAGELGGGHWFEWGQALRQTSLILEPANGRIPPMTEEGQARAAAMESSWSQDFFHDITDFNALDRCITRGMPASMIPFPYNNGLEIFQAPGVVAIRLEMVHETRIIPVDDRPPLPGEIRQWLGESRGHWEGDTLVVETTNFNGESPMVIVGPSNDPVPTSQSLRIVERLTPTGPDTIQYEAWVEDPEVLTAPFKLDFPWRRDDSYQMFEYACHEGNTVVPAYIGATQAQLERGEGGG